MFESLLSQAEKCLTSCVCPKTPLPFDGLDYKNSTGKLLSIAAKGYPDSLAAHAGWWFSAVLAFH